ncbi:MAG: hypothetical protein CM15mP108_2770 [Gammaproteobacteria bacterium]|nr:MAG: hypothetical protein CM15mP108_2770 [Gammaproteobacteria bacterium]
MYGLKNDKIRNLQIYSNDNCFFLFLVLSYILFDAIPGNAFQNLLLNPDLPDYAYDQVVELYGLNDPLITRIQNYVVNFSRVISDTLIFNFQKHQLTLIAERLPRTLMLFSIVNIVAFYTGFS